MSGWIRESNKMTPEASEWISKKIEKLVNEGESQEQAAAIAYSMAKEKGYDVPVKSKASLDPEDGVPDLVNSMSELDTLADLMGFISGDEFLSDTGLDFSDIKGIPFQYINGRVFTDPKYKGPLGTIKNNFAVDE